MAPLAKLVVAYLILFSSLIQISKARSIVTYWGQYTDVTEGTLAEACATKLYSIINIAFLNQFGNQQELGLNISGHYKINYTSLGQEIKACQGHGVKILLSIGGPEGNYSLASEWDAHVVADQLWNSYLGGTSPSHKRPFGDVALDGIDFHIIQGSSLYYEVLLRELKKYGIICTAAPGCLYPDEYLAEAISSGLFDFIWVRFFNSTPCEYNPISGYKKLIISWNGWASSNATAWKLFLGVPASDEAASGFISPDVLNDDITPLINKSANHASVMVWNRYYDRLTNYSSFIKNISLELNAPLPALHENE